MMSLWDHSEAHVFEPVWLGQKTVSPTPPRELQEDLLWFSTSGSSGPPKWIGHSRAGLLASASAVNQHLSLTADDRWLRVLPAFHVGGFSVIARAHAGQVALIESDDRWCPLAFSQLCAREKITLTSLVPTQLFDLVSAQTPAPDSLRAVIIGGAALDPSIAQAARALGWSVLTSYGMTEAGSQIATQPLSAALTSTSALQVLPHWQTRIESDDRLAIRGPALFRAQLTISPTGWIRTEPAEWYLTTDRVQLISHPLGTQLHLLGRHDDWVKILGEKVNLATVRSALDQWAHAHQWSGDWTLILDPDPRRGYHIHLLTTAPLAESDLAAFNDTLAGPARITRHSLVDHIARSPLGKPLTH